MLGQLTLAGKPNVTLGTCCLTECALAVAKIKAVLVVPSTTINYYHDFFFVKIVNK